MRCNLKHLRKAAALSLDALADAADVSKGNLHSIENGQEPRMGTAHKIAAVLDCNVEDIWPNEVQIEETVIAVRRVKEPCNDR